MNTAMAVNASKAVAPFVSLVQDLPLDRIQESKTNPRRTFDETKLAELAGNIRQHGVLQPVLVRPLPDGEDGFFELVAGARRYRASKIAGRETIPATVRELTDFLGRQRRGLQNDHREGRARNEHAGRTALPCRVLTGLRPLLSRIQSPAAARQRFESRASGQPIQD